MLGAGFSSNWGGPLASDVFDWLLQRPEISGDAYLNQMLWNDRNASGFENTLSQVQSDYLRAPNAENTARLGRFQTAINEIFADMDRGFAVRPSWEFQNDVHRTLGAVTAIGSAAQVALLGRRVPGYVFPLALRSCRSRSRLF